MSHLKMTGIRVNTSKWCTQGWIMGCELSQSVVNKNIDFLKSIRNSMNHSNENVKIGLIVPADCSLQHFRLAMPFIRQYKCIYV